MPWRLLALVVILALSLVFVGFNLDNRCDVSFGFAVIKDIPVFFPLLAAFTAGMLFSFPFVFHGKKNAKVQKRSEKNTLGAPVQPSAPLLPNQGAVPEGGVEAASQERK